jgi:hypothetical protein
MGAKAPQDYALQPAQTRYGSGGVERLAGAAADRTAVALIVVLPLSDEDPFVASWRARVWLVLGGQDSTGWDQG